MPARAPASSALRLAAVALVVSTVAALGSAVVAPAVSASVSVAGAAAGDGAGDGDAPQTTSTLPTDNRELGDIIPGPNEGSEPQDPGDPGGWLQVSLFFLVCGAILVIVGAVWLSSRRARRAQEAEGRDPVSLARARGEGLRPPRSAETTEDP